MSITAEAMNVSSQNTENHIDFVLSPEDLNYVENLFQEITGFNLTEVGLAVGIQFFTPGFLHLNNETSHPYSIKDLIMIIMYLSNFHNESFRKNSHYDSWVCRLDTIVINHKDYLRLFHESSSSGNSAENGEKLNSIFSEFFFKNNWKIKKLGVQNIQEVHFLVALNPVISMVIYSVNFHSFNQDVKETREKVELFCHGLKTQKSIQHLILQAEFTMVNPLMSMNTPDYQARYVDFDNEKNQMIQKVLGQGVLTNIGRTIACNPAIRILDMRWLRIGFLGEGEVAGCMLGLRKAALDTLILDNNYLGNLGAQVLDILKIIQDSSIRNLDLSYNNLEAGLLDNGMKVPEPFLFGLGRVLRGFESLNLTGNLLGSTLHKRICGAKTVVKDRLADFSQGLAGGYFKKLILNNCLPDKKNRNCCKNEKEYLEFFEVLLSRVKIDFLDISYSNLHENLSDEGFRRLGLLFACSEVSSLNLFYTFSSNVQNPSARGVKSKAVLQAEYFCEGLMHSKGLNNLLHITCFNNFGHNSPVQISSALAVELNNYLFTNHANVENYLNQRFAVINDSLQSKLPPMLLPLVAQYAGVARGWFAQYRNGRGEAVEMGDVAKMDIGSELAGPCEMDTSSDLGKKSLGKSTGNSSKKRSASEMSEMSGMSGMSGMSEREGSPGDLNSEDPSFKRYKPG